MKVMCFILSSYNWKKISQSLFIFTFYVICCIRYQLLFFNWIKACIVFLLAVLLFFNLFWCKERGGKLVCIIFIVNVVSMHFLATWQFWLFQRPLTCISWVGGGGVMNWAAVWGLAQVVDKAQRWGWFTKVRTPCNNGSGLN